MTPITLKRLAFALALLRLQSDTRAAESYSPTQFPDSSTWGRQIQRTMRFLATSTPEKRHTVRILFCGPSITEQQWARRVEVIGTPGNAVPPAAVRLDGRKPSEWPE